MGLLAPSIGSHESLDSSGSWVAVPPRGSALSGEGDGHYAASGPSRPPGCTARTSSPGTTASTGIPGWAFTRPPTSTTGKPRTSRPSVPRSSPPPPGPPRTLRPPATRPAKAASHLLDQRARERGNHSVKPLDAASCRLTGSGGQELRAESEDSSGQPLV